MPSGTQKRLVISPPARQNSTREAHHLRVDEGIVLADCRDLLVVLDVIGVVAEPGLPLRAVEVGAVESRRRRDTSGRIAVGRLQRAGAGVHDRDLRLRLRIIADRDAFRARQRGNQHVDLVLLDQFLGGAHRRIRAGVGRADDGLDFPAGYFAAVRLHGELVAAHAVFAENGVGAFERRGDADLEFVGGVGRYAAEQRGEAGRGRNSKALAHWGSLLCPSAVAWRPFLPSAECAYASPRGVCSVPCWPTSKA